MMHIRETIDRIEASIDSLIIQDQRDAYRIILKSENILILDTCFITKLYHLNDLSYFTKAIEKLTGGVTPEKIVFVISELVLYELKDSSEDVLQKNNLNFFNNMHQSGFTIVLLREESICENLGIYVSRKHSEWNAFFARCLYENKANLTFLSGIISSDNTIGCEGILEDGYRVPSDSQYIKNTISKIKERKKPKDSLAEELIGVVLLFLFEFIKGSNRNCIIFCSNDYSALNRLGKTIYGSYSRDEIDYKQINLFLLVQFMIKEGIICDKNSVLDLLNKIMDKRIKVIVEKEIPFFQTEIEIDLNEAVDMIFSGEKVQLRTKVK